MSVGPAKKDKEETGHTDARFPRSFEVASNESQAENASDTTTGNIAQIFAVNLLQSLPQQDFKKALKQVAKLWQTELQVESVLLTVPSLDEQFVWTVYHCAENAEAEFSEQYPAVENWLDTQLPLIQTNWFKDWEPEDKRLCQTIPFLLGASLRGVLILRLQETFLDQLESVELAEPAEITLGFLEQVRLAAGAESKQLLRELKLESLAELAAGAGHEINNPLAAISGRAQMLLKQESDPERQQALATIGAQAFRIRDMIGDLMLFGRPPEPAIESVSLNDIVESVCDQQSRKQEQLPGEKKITCLDSPEVQLQADSIQLTQVLNALIENGFQAIEGQGEVTLIWKPGAAGFITLEVTDNGRGLSDLDQEHLFDPFYSGRQAGRGLGFGLSKSWQICCSHQATIQLKSTSDSGSTFLLHWPGSLVSGEE